jgi:hypothetical protein
MVEVHAGTIELPNLAPFVEINKYIDTPIIPRNLDNKIETFAPLVIDLIPQMIDNTTSAPANATNLGVASCSSYYQNNNYYNAWNAFNRLQVSNPLSNMARGWIPGINDAQPTLTYTWSDSYKFSELEIFTAINRGDETVSVYKTILIEGYDLENELWENCLLTGTEATLIFNFKKITYHSFPLNNKNYSAIRIIGNDIWVPGSASTDTSCTISEMQIKSIYNLE